MSLLGKFSFGRLLNQLRQKGAVDPATEITANDMLDEIVGEEISLEGIKELIIEAYSTIDDNIKVLLLERADKLQAQLVQTYRAKGLKITADNICDTLENHRRRFHSH
jgi:hypothetical protein